MLILAALKLYHWKNYIPDIQLIRIDDQKPARLKFCTETILGGELDYKTKDQTITRLGTGCPAQICYGEVDAG